MDCSIIIVSWNTKELLKNCLTTVFTQQGCDFEVLVIDNNSLDGSQEMVRGEFPGVKLFTNTKNRGFAAANNQGMRIATGKTILLLNSDTELTSSDSLVTLLKKQRMLGSGILGPQLMFQDGSAQSSVRSFPTFASQLLILLKLHIIFPKLKILKNYFASDFDYSKDQPVEQVSGACFLISRACYESVGLFDERFWIWFEEVDYCKRAHLAGFSIHYIASPRIIHLGGMSFSKIIPKDRQRKFNQSLLLYAKKYFTPSQERLLAFVAPFSVFLSTATPKYKRQHAYSTPKRNS